MKKGAIVHGTWGAVTLAALGAGMLVASSAKDETTTAATSERSATDAEGRGGKRERTRTLAVQGQRDAGAAMEGAPAREDTPATTFGRNPRTAVVQLDKSDIAYLGEILRTSSNPIERRLAFTRLLEGMTPENAMLIRAQIEKFPADSAVWKEFHYAWGGMSGAEAVMHGNDTKKPDMHSSLAGWADAHAGESLDWFNSLQPTADKGYDNQAYLRWGIVHGLANGDPNSAAQFVLNRAAGGDKDAPRMMSTVANAVLRDGTPAEAAAWTEGLPAGDPRTAAMRRVARDYARSDPAGAAEWAGRYANQPEGPALVSEVGGNWVRRDPFAAVTWLEQLPPSPGRDRGIGTAFGTWARNQPHQAGAYMQQISNPQVRDLAATSATRAVLDRQPAIAAEWAVQISDGSLRAQAMESVAVQYFQQDAAAATQWAQNSGLSAEVQERILNPPVRQQAPAAGAGSGPGP